ncbi:MAG TPA: alpha/beta fold hydrolase [Polyangiaceae bacterium]|nr:alpha/beta fold hydrolase [Polyangiaceae bacterium]
MPYAEVRGLRLYFEEHGAGPTLIVAHGLLGSVATATVMNASKLAERGLRVIAYDARGHGLSEYSRRSEDYSWAAHAEDLDGLMNALGIDRAAICGTSLGAGAALMLALNQPHRVERLILRAPPPFAEDSGAARRQMGLLSTLCRYLGVSLTARIIGMLPGRADHARMLAAQRSDAMLPAIRGLLFDGAPLPQQRLHEIRVPTLILAHPNDAMHPLRSSKLIRDEVPGATLHVTDYAQYWPEHIDEFCDRVASFVKVVAVVE